VCLSQHRNDRRSSRGNRKVESVANQRGLKRPNQNLLSEEGGRRKILLHPKTAPHAQGKALLPPSKNSQTWMRKTSQLTKRLTRNLEMERNRKKTANPARSTNADTAKPQRYTHRYRKQSDSRLTRAPACREAQRKTSHADLNRQIDRYIANGSLDLHL
jgi:hypothetical protein